MITIGFSTRAHDQSYIDHILNTCGVPKDKVEIIEVVNNGEKSLSTCYNEILRHSKNTVNVLIHDDLIFETKKWGVKIINQFKDSDLGIIGLAGTSRMSETGMWWKDRELMVGIVNHTKDGKKWESKYCYNNDNGVLPVVVVDGLFIAVNKFKLKSGFPTDFDGFHFYDVAFCIANKLEGVNIGVTLDVRVTHKSVGMTNDKWEANRVKFVEKYSNVLPLEIGGPVFFDGKQIKLKKEPKTAIVILSKSKNKLLFSCIDSILSVSSYTNFEILIADTGSAQAEKDEIRERYKDSAKIKLVEYHYYNFAEINNDVVNNHVSNDTELLLFCNNDIVLINDAISRMVKVYQNESKCGTVGCRLHFGDGKIQHAGIIAGREGEGIFITHLGLRSRYNYYNGTKPNLWGCTGAFLLVNKKIFLKVGGFVKTSECFEDAILNIDVATQGYHNYYVGNAVCYHFESQSRNEDSLKYKRTQEDYHNFLLPKIKDILNKLGI